jgi:D-glycero-D-manno-heptose 1,7-bisphosphate phosphatase
MTLRRFVVLDRDGTIIAESHYLPDPRQVKLIPGVASGLRQLIEMGLGLVIITNQSAIRRGFFSKERLDLIHRRLQELLQAEGVHLNGIYFYPHTPEDNCRCRKPQPGLIKLAAQELNFGPQLSFMIGDKACVGATSWCNYVPGAH